jgi:hypothetical protein
MTNELICGIELQLKGKLFYSQTQQLTILLFNSEKRRGFETVEFSSIKSTFSLE